jgi:hypothetical protein
LEIFRFLSEVFCFYIICRPQEANGTALITISFRSSKFNTPPCASTPIAVEFYSTGSRLQPGRRPELSLPRFAGEDCLSNFVPRRSAASPSCAPPAIAGRRRQQRRHMASPQPKNQQARVGQAARGPILAFGRPRCQGLWAIFQPVVLDFPFLFEFSLNISRKNHTNF